MLLSDRSCYRRRQGTTAAIAAAVALIAVTLVAAAPPTALAAAKPHCRNLSFEGNGGCGWQDVVEFKVVDVNGDDIHQSCPVQVGSSEAALHFAARLPRDLGSNLGSCPPDASEDPPPTKKCIKGSGGACRYKWKAKKHLVEVCCWEPRLGCSGSSCCGGQKLGNYCDGGLNDGAKCGAPSECPGSPSGSPCRMRTGSTGISLQKKIQPNPFATPAYRGDDDWVPARIPVTTEPVFVNIDPISMTQLPFPSLGSCRVNLGKAMNTLASTIVEALVKCHKARLAGVDITDCNSVISESESDPREGISAAEDALSNAAATCAVGGSPLAFGYGTCPPPCNAITVSTCSVGAVGAPCTSDTDCDTPVGAGNGKCGSVANWGPAANCMACLAEAAITTAVEDKYGAVDSPLSPEDENCQNGIGVALAELVRTHVAATTKCQKLLDSGKSALPFCVLDADLLASHCTAPPSKIGAPCQGDDDCSPPENRLCKNADLGGKRAFAELNARGIIDKSCRGPAGVEFDFSNLETCDVDLVGVMGCVVQNGRTVGNAIADIVYPEGVGHTPCDPCPTPTPPAPTPTPGGPSCPSLIDFVGTGGGSAPFDLGWTGIQHDTPGVSDAKLTFQVTGCENASRPCGVCNFTGPIPNVGADAGDISNRRCTGDTSVKCVTNADCTVAGGTCEFWIGSYTPLSGGGLPTCVGSQVMGSITGTANIETGGMAATVASKWRVYFGLAVDTPCPKCVGDGPPNDGVAGGACSGGKRNGLSCDSNVSLASVHFGRTSLDCPPLDGSLLAVLPVDLSSSTAGEIRTLSASSPSCRAPGFTGLKCFCDTCNDAAATPCGSNADCVAVGATVCGGKRCLGGTNNGAPCLSNSECPGGSCGVPGLLTASNPCDDLICSPNGADPDGPNEGACAGGPFEMFCGPTATFQQCATNADCTPWPGNTCSIGKFRECFTDNGLLSASVLAAGAPEVPVGDEWNPKLGALFCLGSTQSASINTAWGVPGLGRLELLGHARALP